MNNEELRQRLKAASHDPDDFVYQQYRLIEDLEKSEVDPNILRVVLEFMEENPTIEFGVPGPLIPFVERIAGHATSYEHELLESIGRRPTPYTVLMLNRLINVTDDIAERERLIAVLQRAATHPAANEDVKIRVQIYLERLLE
jgi:hypothetical protein